jgi:uncharacterized protein (UPF0548 family)
MPTTVAVFHHRVLINQSADAVQKVMADPLVLFAMVQPRDVTVTPEGHGWRLSSPGRMGKRVVMIDKTSDDGVEVIYRSLSGGFEAFTHIEIGAEPSTSLTVNIEIFANTLKARLSAPLVRMAQRRINTGLDKALTRLSKRLSA